MLLLTVVILGCLIWFSGAIAPLNTHEHLIYLRHYCMALSRENVTTRMSLNNFSCTSLQYTYLQNIVKNIMKI